MVSASKAGVVVAVVVEEMAAEPGPVRADGGGTSGGASAGNAHGARGMNAAARPPVVAERARIMAVAAKVAVDTLTVRQSTGGTTARSA